jgi:arylsulfatase A-like enzyme
MHRRPEVAPERRLGPRGRARPWRGPVALVLALFSLVGACDSTEVPLTDRGSAGLAREPTSASVPTETSRKPPNLILITLDTLRADALGIYGSGRGASPELDRLGGDGVVFERAITSAAETLPSHATLFTGLHPFEHGVRSNAGFTLDEEQETLAERLRDAGYVTAAEIAAPVLQERTRIAQGFAHRRDSQSKDVEHLVVRYRDIAEPIEKTVRTGADITRHGLAFIERYSRSPFFLWLHYFDTHDPYYPPEPFRGRYPGEPYFEEVASVDAQIGRVVRQIEKLGLRERTLVVITADHGEGLGDHGEQSHAFFVYDTTMRVPLIAWGLDLPRGRRVEGLARTVDIVPTTLELLGQPIPVDLRGRSLAPRMIASPTESTAAGEVLGYGEATSLLRTFGIAPIRFVQRGPWKYIHKSSPELYDTVRDPAESMNRIDDEPEIAAGLHAELEAMLREADARRGASTPAGDALTPEAARELEALGYVFAGEFVSVESEASSLVLEGDDPNTRIADVATIAIAKGHIEAGHFEEGLRAMHELAERERDNPYVQNVKLAGLLGLGRHEEAIPLLRAHVERTPANTIAWLDLATSQWALGRRDQALDTLRLGLAELSCAERLHVQSRKWLREATRYAELVDTLGDGADACPESVSLHNDLAWALATLPDPALRDGPRAVRNAQTALDLLGQRDPSVLDTLAAAHAETGNFGEANRVIEEAISQAAGSAGLAAVLAQHQERFRANQALRDPEI